MTTASPEPVAHERAAFEFLGDWTSPVVATAVHAGNDLRGDLASLVVLDDADRFREEDPFTDEIARDLPALVVAHRSRFEIDLNRPRDKAVYRVPADCWDLEVWRGGALDEARVDESLEQYDAFFDQLAARLDPLAERGPFVLFDVHSYNHRRDGAGHDPLPQADNPDVNVGTGSLDRARWAPVVDAFITTMSQQRLDGEPLDVRENVRFRGANVAAWTHERYPGTGCALALEFKKVFMDEWTGVPDEVAIREIHRSLAGTVPAAIRHCHALATG